MNDLKARYELAKKIYQNTKLGNVASMMIRFIEEKQKGTTTVEMFNKAIDYIGRQCEDTINNQGTIALALADLKEIWRT